MNDPIMITPHDIGTMIMAVCGAIISISAAMAVLAKLVSKLKEPDRHQNDRITNLEEEVKSIQDRLKLGNKHFENDGNRIDAVEDSMKRSNQVIIRGLQVLIEHSIDGNNLDEMREMKHELDKYLLEKGASIEYKHKTNNTMYPSGGNYEFYKTNTVTH